MNILKKLILGLVIFLALLTIISFFLPSQVKVERSMVMKANATTIFNQVNDLHNWFSWASWNLKDPNMKVTYFGPASGVGSGYNWESEHRQVGKGKMSIIASIPNDSISTDLDFMENGKAHGYFTFRPAEAGTKVTWGMDCDMSTPFVLGKYIGLLMDGMLGKDFEEGLKNLDEVSSKAPAMTIQMISIPAKSILTMRVKCPSTEIGNKLGETYTEISKFMAANGISAVGAPFAIYHSYSETADVDMEPGMPIDYAKADSKTIKKGEIKAQDVVVADYYGPYEKTGTAHEAVSKWIKENGKTIAGSPWEEYVTDPGTEPDSTKWLTKVYYPVN